MKVKTKRFVRNLALAGLSSLALGTATLATSAAASNEVAAPITVAPPVQLHTWSAPALAALKAEIAAAAAEGLDPTAYGAEALNSLSEGSEADRAATRIATALALDYARGSIDSPDKLDWHIERPAADLNALTRDIEAAARDGRLREQLRSLLPTDARYAALRDAYVATPASDIAMRDRLRANLERWRWMPRELGKDHIYVNVPSYTLQVVDEGRPVSAYTVVVGAPSTPTPQMQAEARSVVVNPWWNVPRSIARTLNANPAKGYVREGHTIRQRPGPGNALGKVKIDMPNPHAIYLHDTPSKALFAKESRAFSHGCIRVKDIDRLAVELVELDMQKPVQVERALAGSSTQTLPLRTERAVYLVYFTADVGADGRVTTYEDPYGRDAKLIASLDREVRMAPGNRKRSPAAA